MPEDLDIKNLLTCGQTLISTLYLCLGEKEQEEFTKRWPHMDLGATRYPRVVDALEADFEKERNLRNFPVTAEEATNKRVARAISLGA